LTLPQVVIVGGGFGGLSAASALRSAQVSVTLIDKRNYHLFRPMLYQVATGLLSGDEISSPLRSIFSGQKNVQILFDEVTGIDSGQGVVHLSRGDVPYDFSSWRLASGTTISGTTNGGGSLQGSNRSTTPTSFAAKYCVHSSEPRRWLQLNVRNLRKFVVSLPSRSSVAGP
jgi:thioredoxin reductase